MIFILKLTKGHNSVKLFVELWLLLSAYCLIMLYICTKICENISNGFKVTDLNSRVEARVVANVDSHMNGWTNKRMNGHKTGSLRHA